MTRREKPQCSELTVVLWLSALAVVVGIVVAVLSCREWKW